MIIGIGENVFLTSRKAQIMRDYSPLIKEIIPFFWLTAKIKNNYSEFIRSFDFENSNSFPAVMKISLTLFSWEYL